MASKSHRPHYHHLKNKWVDKHKKLQLSLWEKHKDTLEWFHDTTKNVVLGSLAGVLMLTHLNPTALISQNLLHVGDKKAVHKEVEGKHYLMTELKSALPDTVQPLTTEQEQNVASILSRRFNMNVSAELEGKRLNRSYGIIGAEQHLMRYPGDTIDTHFATPEEAKYISSGMAPGRGAWGYFAPSAAEMTQKDVDREKYYLAVQTFLAPGWNDDVAGHYKFFKFRKMLIVNPENGKAMVVVIGDAGPAPFTGKHLGGSPEVMSYLERQDGGARGPVLYFFIDDPDDTIPLGPVEVEPTYEATLL